MWKAVLNMTGVVLDQISDDKRRIKLENIKRGVPSSIWVNRYAKRGIGKKIRK